MLFKFKSAACFDVIMFGDAARRILGILGKDPENPKGIVTVEQLPDAIERLHAAIREDQARHLEPDEDEEAARREAGHTGMAAPVHFSQRAWPLLDMLRASQREGVPVVWGV